jgi:lipopolysaccharide export system protein LptA
MRAFGQDLYPICGVCATFVLLLRLFVYFVRFDMRIAVVFSCLRLGVRFFFLWFLLLNFVSLSSLWAQGGKKGGKREVQSPIYYKDSLPAVVPQIAPIDTVNTPLQRIEMLYAGELEGDVLPNGEKIRIVRRDKEKQVQFKQKNTLMFCDTAYQYLDRNHIEAYGNIRFIENDSVTLVGDTLFYNGNTKLAELWGNVVLQDQEKTVRTRRLNYDMHRRVAYYYEGGTVYDRQSNLTSERGYYNTDTKIAAFAGKVQVRGQDTFVDGDSITYDTNTKIAYFDEDAIVRTRDGRIEAQKGSTYNTTTGVMKGPPNATGRTKLENKEYLIDARFVDFDNVKEKGVAKGDVKLYYKKEKTTLYGDQAYYDGIERSLEAYGNALLIRPLEGDTLFVAADTIIAHNDTIPSKQKMFAYRKVRIFARDFQAICDSLTYDLADSLIYLDFEPYIWAEITQLSGKNVKAKMVENRLERLDIKEKAFVVSQNRFGQFDQIKGRDLEVHFDSLSQIQKVLVNGNGESLYHLLEETKKSAVWKGLNYIKCSNIHIYFADSNKIKEIRFLQSPEGKVIPPQKVDSTSSRLENFAWKIDQRPTREGILAGRNPDGRQERLEIPEGKLIIDDIFKVYYDEKNQKITFFKRNAQPSDFEQQLYLWLYPQDLESLPEALRDEAKQGFISPAILVYPDMIRKGEDFRFSPKFPPFKIRKIVAGQREIGKGDKWKGVYEVAK